MIYLGNGIYSDSGPDVLAHGREWKTHKYIAIKNGRYIYPEDVKKTSGKDEDRRNHDPRAAKQIHDKAKNASRVGNKTVLDAMNKAASKKKHEARQEAKAADVAMKKKVSKSKKVLSDTITSAKNKKRYENSVERYKTKKRLIESNKPHNWNR